MKNTYGSSVSITIFGESHGHGIGAVLDGLPPGIPVDEEYISGKLTLRRPFGALSTKRVEPDHFQILSGVYQGYTTGTPICIMIPNEDTRSRDYAATRFLARPGHADYTAFCKYHGYEDFRGGGHFSGRITAGLVACGAIALSALERKGILIGTHISRCAGISDREFENVPEDIKTLSTMAFATLNEEAADKMQEAIKEARLEGDSVGGILETAVWGLPAGVGEPWFDSLESVLSHAIFAIPAVKGVEFGDGFAMADLKGSQANDSFVMEDEKVVTRTNHNGGINGGISNGMPVIFRCAIKPTPSIGKEQDTIDFNKYSNEKLLISGRHDPAIVHRARIVVDAATALAICDMLTQRFGTDYLGGEL
jgi:chorismate synthase